MPIGNDALGGDDAELTDHEVSLLCDVGDTFPATLSAEKQARLESLIARGFIRSRARRQGAGEISAHCEGDAHPDCARRRAERGVKFGSAWLFRERDRL